MDAIELLEAVKVASDGDRMMGLYVIPVLTEDGYTGTIYAPHVIDRLITEGWPDENTKFAVSYEDEFGDLYEDWVPMWALKINGPTQLI